jgi:altronate dehydratase
VRQFDNPLVASRFASRFKPLSEAIPFEQVGRLPAPGDNVAIATRRLEAGTQVRLADNAFTLPHTILEGHRFATVPIAVGGPLLSWGLPFGWATRDLMPGDYACNEKILTALKQRHVDFALPSQPNFKDHYVPYTLDERVFKPGQRLPNHPQTLTFDGFARGNRGAGTRNFIVVLGTTSLTGSFARQLADRFKDVPQRYPNIDGVVAVAHTEGGGTTRPNNYDFTVRTLAGFMVNPNVAAVLCADYGTEVITNATLKRYLDEHDYPRDGWRSHFISLRGNLLASDLKAGEAIIKSWLEPVNACERTPQLVRHLKIGLQCGGSDAFSGISGNPLVGWISRELVRYGGSASLAETDELIGAEPYILDNVKDLPTARAFLHKIEVFQERARWHGTTGEGNPSGGNNYRGLYNIAVKSIGAARKKDPATMLDRVINFADLMPEPGFYFMDSPGNDLESIAGQVGSGCNLILFTTGNGSITNFPFVPTIKLMTSTGRFNLLVNEMDFNAGRYLDGVPMDELGREALDYTLKVASGRRSAGERAGHAQVQLWREWRQTDASRVEKILSAPRPSGEAIPLENGDEATLSGEFHFASFRTATGHAADQVGLIIPTSLCSGQVGRMIAEKLNQRLRFSASPARNGVSRFLALAHTEGCGVTGGESEMLYVRAIASYLRHPFVRAGLMLEHGCERTHNDAMRNFLVEQGVNLAQFGYASIQLDGGIERVTDKVEKWFDQSLAAKGAAQVDSASLSELRLGLTAVGEIPAPLAEACAWLVRTLCTRGGLAVVPQNSTLLGMPSFVETLRATVPLASTLAYGCNTGKRGFHIMEAPTDHHVETLTGLAGTGAEVMLVCTTAKTLQGHPLVPTLQVGAISNGAGDDAAFDLVVDNPAQTPPAIAGSILDLLLRTLSREYTPKLAVHGNVDFQMTRGELGLTL